MLIDAEDLLDHHDAAFAFAPANPTDRAAKDLDGAPKPIVGRRPLRQNSNSVARRWPVRFAEAAREELIEAQDWYGAEDPGLGSRFRAEIDGRFPDALPR